MPYVVDFLMIKASVKASKITLEYAKRKTAS